MTVIIPTDYLPEIAWSTIVNNVVMINSTTYEITISAEDVNEAGSGLLEVGFYLKDFIGHTYSITAINVGDNPQVIQVTDDFVMGYGPQTGQYAYIYKSVGEGLSPYIAPIKYGKLDNSALDTSRAVELDIIWKNFTTIIPDKYVRYVQGVTSDVWVINHNMNKYPAVSVMDNAGTEYEGDIKHTDNNNLTITFSTAFSGFADLN